MRLRLAVLAMIVLPLQACAEKGAGSMHYSLDGPPLAIAAEQGGKTCSGHMERASMLGQGGVAFQFDGFVCADSIKNMPNESGHVAAILRCDNGELLMVTFRPLGPDQGIGIGRNMSTGGRAYGEPLIFYFHPWEDEARRRLEQEKNILMDIINKREQK